MNFKEYFFKESVSTFAVSRGEAITLLGLKKGYTINQLKQAYRKAALENHPDKGGNPITFMKIQSAFETLKQQENYYVNYDLLGVLLMSLGGIGKYKYGKIKHVPFISNYGLDINSLKIMRDPERIENIHDEAKISKNQSGGVTRTGMIHLSEYDLELVKEWMNQAIEIGTKILSNGVQDVFWNNIVNYAKEQLEEI